jgi:hypothetical protein
MLHWVKSCANFAIIGLNLLKAYEDKSAYAMCIFPLVLGPREEQITFVGKTTVRFHILIMEFSSYFSC